MNDKNINVDIHFTAEELAALAVKANGMPLEEYLRLYLLEKTDLFD